MQEMLQVNRDIGTYRYIDLHNNVH